MQPQTILFPTVCKTTWCNKLTSINNCENMSNNFDKWIEKCDQLNNELNNEPKDISLEDLHISEKNGVLNLSELLKLNRIEPKKYEVHVNQSENVHIGDVTVLKGPLTVNISYPDAIYPQPAPTINNNNNNNAYETVAFNMISRRNWLAQPPNNPPQTLQQPAKLVIICHTATEDGFTQAENVLLVRLIQSFHIDSRKWDDIGYNFLVGSDDNIYEGRGWNAIGAHTKGYNDISVAIAFIGCFQRHLPPLTALRQTKALISRGVQIGAIARDYKLVGHRQCRPFGSPGDLLFEEITKWEHFDASVHYLN